MAASERAALPKIIDTLEPGSILYADETKAYGSLHALFDLRRINHSKRYAQGRTSTNQAESFFARFKRAVRGVFHHVSGPYTQNYVGRALECDVAALTLGLSAGYAGHVTRG